MDLSTGEPPNQPSVHCPKQQLPPFCPVPGARDIVEQPFDLGSGKIGVNEQAGIVPDIAFAPVLFHLLALGRGAAALPDDGVVDGAAGRLVPDDGGFPLVGDADGGHLGGRNTGLPQDPAQHLPLGTVDFLGVVFHPAGLGIDLGKLLLRAAHHLLPPVEQDGTGAGSALIQGKDIRFHRIIRSFPGVASLSICL